MQHETVEDRQNCPRAIETLAIIAITPAHHRAEIEEIRGDVGIARDF